jgi:hypothetical protein
MYIYIDIYRHLGMTYIIHQNYISDLTIEIRNAHSSKIIGNFHHCFLMHFTNK